VEAAVKAAVTGALRAVLAVVPKDGSGELDIKTVLRDFRGPSPSLEAPPVTHPTIAAPQGDEAAILPSDVEPTVLKPKSEWRNGLQKIHPRKRKRRNAGEDDSFWILGKPLDKPSLPEHYRQAASLTPEKRLKDEREKSGLTQRQVAELAEVPLGEIKRLENGKSPLMAAAWNALTPILGLDDLSVHEVVKKAAARLAEN
jgi:DNA-binding XRE family transcriptional regulator